MEPIREKDLVVTLVSLSNATRVNETFININPNLLFTCAMVLFEWYKDIKPYFSYKLKPIPTSLFKINDRKAKQSNIHKIIYWVKKAKQKMRKEQLIQSIAVLVSLTRDPCYIKLFGQQELNFRRFKTVKLYHEFVIRHYGNSIIIFDGYENVASTKDHEHLRRLMDSGGYPDVNVDLKNVGQFSENKFSN